MGDYNFSNKSLEILKTVDPRLQALVHSVLANSKYDFGIPETGGKRSAEMQNQLFKKKYSKLDGYVKKSFHQSGHAIDIFIHDEHGVCYEFIDKYEEISKIFIKNFKIMRHIGIFPEYSYIRWGGDWNRNEIRVDKDPNESFLDIPHFEIRGL